MWNLQSSRVLVSSLQSPNQRSQMWLPVTRVQPVQSQVAEERLLLTGRVIG